MAFDFEGIQSSVAGGVEVARDVYGVGKEGIGRAQSLGKDVFSTVTGVISFVRFAKNVIKRYTYKSLVGDIAPDYQVTITRTSQQPIGADIPEQAVLPLQGEVSMGVKARWETFVPTDLNNTVNKITSIFAKTVLMTKSMTRRMWMGTDPITITLELRLEAENSAKEDVRQVCLFLQSLILPYLSKKGSFSEGAKSVVNTKGAKLALAGGLLTGFGLPIALTGVGVAAGAKGLWDSTGGFGLLHPPGPSPIELGYQEDMKEQISIQIGRFLYFDNVIIQECDISVPPKFADDGSPISATFKMTFQTYEIVTRDDLVNIYSGGKQNG